MLKIRSALPLALPVAWLLLIGAEVACANLAWHTVGEIHSSFLLFLVWLNAVPLLAYALDFKRLAVAGALLLATLIVPHQVFLGLRWKMLERETVHIVADLNRVKKRTGSYPKNLSAYNYLRPSLKGEIVYTRYKQNDYTLKFHIGSPSTEHWYEAGSGWWYYPD